MDLRLTYLLRNLTRNLRRTLLTTAAVAIPILIYVLSTATIDGIERFLDNSAAQLRLAVTHKSSIVNPLPQGHRQRIEALDPSRTRITSVCGLRWIGGKLENDRRTLSTLAADADTFAATFPEYLRNPAQRERWFADRQALIVGRDTARQFGWAVGDRVTILPSAPPYSPMSFNIVATSDDSADTITNWFRRDYLEEELKNFGAPEGYVAFFYVKCATKADLEHYRREIDALFANTPDETHTQDEKAFMNQFITQQFDLPRNLTLLALVTVFVAVTAAANTMNMNFRDRISEFATLKSLGFGATLVFWLILAESLLLCGLGGLLGAGIPYVAFTYTPLSAVTLPLVQSINVAPLVCVQGLAAALGIGLLAGLSPARSAARLHVVAAFRALE